MALCSMKGNKNTNKVVNALTLYWPRIQDLESRLETTYRLSAKTKCIFLSFSAVLTKRHLEVSSVLGGWRCEKFCFRINQESGEGGVAPLVAVDGIALVLLTVQPHTVPPTEGQQQTLTLHLPPLRRVLVEHHRLHLALPRHQLHGHGLTGVFPHSEGKEVSPRVVAGEKAWGFVEMTPDVDILHVKGQRLLFLLLAALTHERGRPSHREGRARLLGGLVRALGGGQAWWGQVVADVAGCGDVRVDEVTRERDVRPSVAVQGILRTLLQKQPHRVHLLQTDHDALTLNFPSFLAVVIVRYRLHLLPVLHQDDRKHFLWELPHWEGEVVRPRDATAEATSVWIEIPSDVDHEPVEGHGLLLASHYAAGLCGGESRAQTGRYCGSMKGRNWSREGEHDENTCQEAVCAPMS